MQRYEYLKTINKDFKFILNLSSLFFLKKSLKRPMALFSVCLIKTHFFIND